MAWRRGRKGQSHRAPLAALRDLAKRAGVSVAELAQYRNRPRVLPGCLCRQCVEARGKVGVETTI